MDAFQIALISATLLCSLVAGFVFAFACVIMPGLATLSDREFLLSFQAMDRVIQNNQPLFVAVWAGSALTLIISAVIGFGRVTGLDQALLLAAAGTFLLGVQLPTVTINVPLNNQVQTLDLVTMEEAQVAQARRDFEGPWNRWNQIRTVLAILTSAGLLILILRL